MTLELALIAADPLVTEWGLTDMHEPIDIIDKEIMIGNNQNVLVAEDNISQGITFRMLRNYDGIDLSSKNIYAEYIPIGSDVIFRDLIKTGNINLAPDKPSNGSNEEDYISILWEVTVNTTRQPGIVPFAICAEDAENRLTSNDQGISRQYVWQTLPSQIIIQKNLGRRESSIAEPNGQTLSEQLLMHMDNTFVKFNNDTPTDSNDDVLTSGSDETEIVLDGGGAPNS